MSRRPDRWRAHAARLGRAALGAHARRHGGAHARARGVEPWWQRLDAPPPATTKTTATSTPAAAAALPPVRPRRARRKSLDHPGVLVAVLIAALVLPIAVLIERMATATAAPHVVQVSSVKGSPSDPLVVPSPASTRPLTPPAPSTTAPPTTVAPTTVVTTTTVQPTTTSTTTAPTTTATTTTPPTTAPPTTAPPPSAPPAPQHSETGEGTWYNYQPGGCANNTLPKGTVVTVTNLATGATTTCVVNDTGGFGPPRILDMDESVFSRIGDPGSGVINIRISW